MTDGPENVMAQELKEATDALADDGGAQVTHVHLFGDVWGGEVHHHLQKHKSRFIFPNDLFQNLFRIDFHR